MSSNTPTSLSFPVQNGELLIDGTSGPISTTLTAGANVNIQNGADVILLSATGTTGDTKWIERPVVTTTDATPTTAFSVSGLPATGGVIQIWGAMVEPSTGNIAWCSNGVCWVVASIAHGAYLHTLEARTTADGLLSNSLVRATGGTAPLPNVSATYTRLNNSPSSIFEIVVVGEVGRTYEWRFGIQYTVAAQ